MQTRNRIVNAIVALLISFGFISFALFPNGRAMASPQRAGNHTAAQTEEKLMQGYSGHILSDGQFVYGPNVALI